MVPSIPKPRGLQDKLVIIHDYDGCIRHYTRPHGSFNALATSLPDPIESQTEDTCQHLLLAWGIVSFKIQCVALK